MKLLQHTVSALAVCTLVWIAPLAFGQGDAATTPPAGAPSASADARAGAEPKPAGKATESQKRYIIGPLDVLVVKVWNQPQLSSAVDVGPDGMISMSLIGEVKADGLTAPQLRDAIQARLSDCCLKDPLVEVTVAKINSKRYYVYGGVLKPGAFPLVEKTTIMDALSQVGFKEFARLNKITIQRGDQTFRFNYNDFRKSKNKDKNVNIELQNGDRIYVPE